jgi:cyclic pyranopterin phosphate synthase
MVPRSRRLSHVDGDGKARMVDVSDKAVTVREAVARGRITITPAAMRLVRAGGLAKGAVEEAARLAGVLIEARVRTEAKTGAEMEALHAVSVAALTVYDMVKAADKGMTIGEIRLVKKTGGRSGVYRAR